MKPWLFVINQIKLHIFSNFFELLPFFPMGALPFQTVALSFSKHGRAIPLLFCTTNFAVNSYYSQFIRDDCSYGLGLIVLLVAKPINTFIETMTKICDRTIVAVSDDHYNLVEGPSTACYNDCDMDQLISQNCGVGLENWTIDSLICYHKHGRDSSFLYKQVHWFY